MKKIKKIEDLTLIEYEKFDSLIKSYNEEEDMIYAIEILELLNYDVDSMSVEKFQKTLFNIFSQEVKPLKHLPLTIKLLNKRYDILYDINKLTASQFIDLQSHISNGNKPWNLLSVFVIPRSKWLQKGKYGKNYSIIELQEIIKNNVTIKEFKTISTFFLRNSQLLSAITLQFSKKLTVKMRIAKLKEVMYKHFSGFKLPRILQKF